MKRGRKKKIIDADVVFHMTRYNLPVRAIAEYLGVHRSTLYESHGDALKEGREASIEDRQNRLEAFLASHSINRQNRLNAKISDKKK